MPALRNKPYFFIKQIPATSKNHSKYLPVCQGGSKRHNNGTPGNKPKYMRKLTARMR